MNSQPYIKALSIIEQHPELCGFCGGVSEEVVVKAEEKLDLRFPGDYRDFLLRFGAGNFGSMDVYGIIDDDFDDSGIPDAVWYTTRLREEVGLLRSLVAIHDTGGGEIFCLDISKPNAPIVAYAIGYDLEVQTYEVIANDFGEFLLDRVEFVLEAEAEDEG